MRTWSPGSTAISAIMPGYLGLDLNFVARLDGAGEHSGALYGVESGNNALVSVVARTGILPKEEESARRKQRQQNPQGSAEEFFIFLRIASIGFIFIAFTAGRVPAALPAAQGT